MSYGRLSSRAIIGTFYQRLEAASAQAWSSRIGMRFESDQGSEEYAWLGMPPAMREWLGGRQAKRLRDAGFTVVNKDYEATLEIPLPHLRRDKTGQILVRVRELAVRGAQHWAQLLTTLIQTNGNGYDGAAFFATTHAEGNSGTQSNLLTLDIAAPSDPTAAEMEKGVLKAVAAIVGMKDDQGEPLSSEAMQFLVMVPTNMAQAALAAVNLPQIVDGSASRTALIANLQGFRFEVVTNPRLTATDKYYVFRTDGDTKSFILQEEVPLEAKYLGEGSDYEFENNAHLFSVDASRAAGYGVWQQAIRIDHT